MRRFPLPRIKQLSNSHIPFRNLCRFTSVEIYSYCNTTHENTSGKTKALVKQYLPELFQPTLLCAGYESADQGSCQGDSGGPLMFYNTKLLQFFQVGIVSGGVSICGDKEIPGYYTRLDHPDISEFVHNANDILSKGEYKTIELNILF